MSETKPRQINNPSSFEAKVISQNSAIPSKNNIAYSINLKPAPSNQTTTYFKNYNDAPLKAGPRTSHPKYQFARNTGNTRIITTNRSISNQANKPSAHVTKRIITGSRNSITNLAVSRGPGKTMTTTTVIKNHSPYGTPSTKGQIKTIISKKSSQTLPQGSYNNLVTTTTTQIKSQAANPRIVSNLPRSLARLSYQAPSSTMPQTAPSKHGLGTGSSIKFSQRKTPVIVSSREHRFSRAPYPIDEYGQRSKSRKLHLVEDNSEYKRFQFVSRSREKTVYRSAENLNLSALDKVKLQMERERESESEAYLKNSYAPEKFSAKMGSIRKSNKRVTVIRDGVETQLSVFNRD